MYTTDQLVAATGVAPRTLSDYVKKGLLPQSPDGYWYEEHVQRLLAIQLLKAANVIRLADVKARLDAMTPEALAAFVEENLKDDDEGGTDDEPLVVVLPRVASPFETRRVVEAYFTSWVAQRIDDAYAMLAPDLEFSGPTASYSSAEAFRPALVTFAAMTKGARKVAIVVEGDRAALLYDCDLPEPVGTVRIASFFWVTGGKIRKYDTRFDATELRKLQAARTTPSPSQGPR